MRGGVLGRAEAGASNQATTGPAGARRALAAAVGQACAAAGRPPSAVAGACFGLAGLDHPSDEAVFRAAVEPLGLGVPALLVNDAVIAWAGATGGAAGIAVIAGTGSVAYGRNGAGTGGRAGGWGGVLGDEGSAYRLAAGAVNRVLRAVDGRDRPTALAALLAAAAGVPDPADLCLLARAGRGEGEPVEAVIARLAPAVAAAAAAGVPEAQALVDEAGAELASLAAALAARLGLEAPAVHGLGSVLLARGPVAQAADAQLRARLGVGLLPPRHPALVGALVLAHEQARGALPAESLCRAWGAAG